jgi:DNA mismatch repair protein MutS
MTLKYVDLNIAEDIIPLFDYTNNKYSKEILGNFFCDLSLDVTRIKERQEVIQELSKTSLLNEFTNYSPVDLYELKDFLDNIGSQKNYFKSILKYWSKGNEKIYLNSKIKQVYYFLSTIQKNLYLKKDLSEFPFFFKNIIDEIRLFFESIELNNNYKLFLDGEINSKKSSIIIENLYELAKLGKITQFWSSLFHLEVYCSIALAAKKNGFTVPIIDDHCFEINDFYYPTLENPVCNSINAINNLSIITGPNMSGKSVLLKAIGLCVYLSKIGLSVPAKFCKIPYFDKLFITINSRDDTQKGHSHFLNEIKVLKEVFNAIEANEKCFVIFDEIFNGTNIEDATLIFYKTIKGLQKIKNSYFFVSTHLQKINSGSNINQYDTYYLNCYLDGDYPFFTYILSNGWSNLKFGNILFMKEGLDQFLS